MSSLLLPMTELQTETRRKTPLKLRMNRAAPPAGAYAEDLEYDRKFPGALRRNVGPCNTYNCHGLTFGVRRAEVSFADVPSVLEEDEYTEIDRRFVMPGDVAIYFSTAEPI